MAQVRMNLDIFNFKLLNSLLVLFYFQIIYLKFLLVFKKNVIGRWTSASICDGQKRGGEKKGNQQTTDHEGKTEAKSVNLRLF